MTNHRQIMINVGQEIADSEEIADASVARFGRPLLVQIGACPSQIPDAKDAPFLWIHADDVESERVAADEVFTVRCVLGGTPKGENGENIIVRTIKERTADENGLMVCTNGDVEELRDIIIEAVREACAGAILRRVRIEENDLAHYPLDWAIFYIEYEEPEAL